MSGALIQGSRPVRVLAAVALVLIAACSSPVMAGAADYVLRESAVDGPSTLGPAGPTTLHATNTGDYSHTLVVTDSSGTVIGATGLVESGEQAALDVDLRAGIYVFSCRIVSEDGEGNLIDHYEQGMHRTVTVTG